MAIGGALGEMIIRVGADISDLSKGLESGADGVDAFVSRVEGIGAGLVAFGGVVSGVMLTVALQVDDAMDRIRVSTGSVGRSLAQLEGDFEAVASTVPSSLADASEAISDLSRRTDQTGEGLQTLAAQVLNLSRMTGENLSGLISGTTRGFADWNIATERQTASLDYLFRASQATGVEVGALSQRVVQFGAPLRQLGFTFEQSAALLAQFEREGVNAELVLGGLRRGLSQFAKAGLDGPAALNTIIQKIEELGPGTEAAALAMKVFGTRAGPDMAAAILEGRLAIDDLVTQLTESTETINGVAAETADLGESMVLLRNRAVLALNALASPILPTFTGWANKAIDVVEDLARWIEGISPSARKAVVSIALLTAGLGTFLISIAAATRAWVALNAVLAITTYARLIGNFAIMVTRIRSVADAAVLLRVSWATLMATMGPVGWIALAVTALGGLAYAFTKAGDSAEAAARRAKRATDDFRASLAGLSEFQVRIETADLERQEFELTRQVEALKAAGQAFRTVRLGGSRADFGVEATTIQVPTREFSRLSEALEATRGKLSAAQVELDGIKEATAAASEVTRTYLGDLGDLEQGSKDTADAVRRLATEAAEFQRLQRIGLVTRDQAPEGLQSQFASVDELRDRIQSVRDDLTELGAAAPAGTQALLDALQIRFAEAERVLTETIARMEAAMRGGINVSAIPVQVRTPGVMPSLGSEQAAAIERAARAMDLYRRRALEGQRQTRLLVDSLFELSRVLGPLGRVGGQLSQVAADVGRAVDAVNNMKNVGGTGGVTGGVPTLLDVASAALPIAGAVAQGIQSAIGLFGSIFGGNSEWAQTVNRNREALDKLRQEINGFRLTFAVQANLGEGIEALLRQREFLENSGAGFFGRPTPGRQKDRVEAILDDFGLTLADLNAAAERFGIDLYDSQGRIILGAVAQLAQALELSAESVEKFASTVEGQRRLLDARNDIFDITDPATLLQGQFDFLQQLAPDLLREFGLANLNLQTATGRAVLEQGLRDLIEALGAGAIDAGLLEGFESVDEFIKHLLDTDNALDQFAETAQRAGESLVNAVEGFKVEAYRFRAQQVESDGRFVTPTSRPTDTGGTSGGTTVTKPIVVHGGDIHLHGNDPITLYRQLYQHLGQLSRANPDMRDWFESLTPA